MEIGLTMHPRPRHIRMPRMRRHRLPVARGLAAYGLLVLGMALTVAALPGVAAADDDRTPLASPAASQADQAAPKKELLSGRVVLLSEALKRRGIKSYAEEIKGQVVLESTTGELLPIVPDWRGRAFFQDKRLRNRPVDLIANRRPDVPYLQVLSIFTFDEDGARQLTDYWCDICSIPMYELKDCECCQGEIRLRFQPKELPEEQDSPPAPKPAAK